MLELEWNYMCHYSAYSWSSCILNSPKCFYSAVNSFYWLTHMCYIHSSWCFLLEQTDTQFKEAGNWSSFIFNIDIFLLPVTWYIALCHILFGVLSSTCQVIYNYDTVTLKKIFCIVTCIVCTLKYEEFMFFGGYAMSV